MINFICLSLMVLVSKLRSSHPFTSISIFYRRQSIVRNVQFKVCVLYNFKTYFLVEVKTQSDDCGATCRYELADALVMSQWSVSDEQKQPLIGLKWIQAMDL